MQRVTILYDASQAVLSTFDLDEVLNQILFIVRDYFNLENGCILLADDDGEMLYVRTHFGNRPKIDGFSIPFGKGLTGSAATLKRPVYAPDVAKDTRYISTIGATRSELAIPLMVQDKVVGVLDCQSDELDHFDSETIDLLTLFAAQASIGIQNAKLYSLVKRRAALLEAINTLAKQTTVELDTNELLDRFCNQLPQSFPVDHVAVFLRDAEDNISLRTHSPLSDGFNTEYLRGKLRDCDHVHDALDSLVSGSLECLPPCAPQGHADVCLPLVSFGKNIGVLVCSSTSLPRFASNEVQALESVADILATALQNSTYVERVRQLAYRDGLTGIFNRRFFESKLVEELSRAQRYGGAVAVLMIDIDHFKNVNDEFGHLLGDEVLKNSANIFGRQLRKVDFVCRFGGEEFGVILPATNLTSAMAVAEKLRRTVASHEFAGIPRPVTISIGVAAYPEQGSERDTIVSAADKALYMAKQDGRNRVFSAELSTTA